MRLFAIGILDFCMTGYVKVMLVALDGLPSLSPFHVLNQLAKSALDLSLSSRCFVDVPNSGSDVPVPTLMNIHVNVCQLTCWIPEVFPECLGRERRPSSTEKQRHRTHINLMVFV